MSSVFQEGGFSVSQISWRADQYRYLRFTTGKRYLKFFKQFLLLALQNPIHIQSFHMDMKQTQIKSTSHDHIMLNCEVQCHMIFLDAKQNKTSRKKAILLITKSCYHFNCVIISISLLKSSTKSVTIGKKTKSRRSQSICFSLAISNL